MEVAHSDDHVTHAIIGGTDKIDFTMSDDGFFMQMLSASLYKDQRMAVAREVLCNADDAHKEHGVTRPFEVTLTTEKLIIRDFGPGIPHDMIGPIYATYGKSTKQGSDISTGGFGLGCKSPFAYTDNFQVTSYCNGTKTVYRMSKSDSEVGGKPSIVKIVSVPTTETGLEVNINMANSGDVRSFMTRIVKVLANGEMNALLNGTQAAVLPFSRMKHGYMLTTDDPLLEHHVLLVRYGAVLYPIPEHEEYATLYGVAYRMVREVEGNSHNFCLILEAPPGSLSLTPSRETLTITPTTVQTVRTILENFIETFRKSLMVDVVATYEKAVDRMGEEKNAQALLASPSDVRNYSKYVETNVNEEGNLYIVDSKDLASWQVTRKYPGATNWNIQLRDIRKRTALLMQCDNLEMDKGLLRGFAKALRRSNNAVDISEAAREHFKRRVISPVIIELRKPKYKYLLSKQLFVFSSNSNFFGGRDYYYRHGPSLRNAEHYAGDSFVSYLHMQKRVIVLTHDEDNVRHRIEGNRRSLGIKESVDISGFLVYQVSRVRVKLDEAREFCEALKEYQFIDLTKKVEYREPKKRVVTVSEKKTGFAQLRGVQVEDKFDWTLITQANLRVENPDAYAGLYGKSKYSPRGQDKLQGISAAASAQTITNLYGHRIAALMNAGQIEKLSNAGLPPLSEWVPKQIVKDLEGDTELLRALPGTWDVLNRWIRVSEKKVDTAFLKLVLRNAAISDALKLPELGDVPMKSFQLFTAYKTLRAEFPKMEESDICQKIKTMEPNAKLRALVEKLDGNKLLDLVDTKAVGAVFEGDDDDLKTKTIKIIKTIIKG